VTCDDAEAQSIGVVLTRLKRTMPQRFAPTSQQLTVELQFAAKELQQTNEELAEKARQLADQNAEVERKNQEVEQARRALEDKAAELGSPRNTNRSSWPTCRMSCARRSIPS